MIRSASKKIRSDKFHKLLHKYDIKAHFFLVNRRMVAKAVLIGVFFALLPVPSQIVLVILATMFIRFNIVIALSIVLLTNPLTMPFVVFAEYKLGTLLMGQHIHMQMELSMEWIEKHFAMIVVPLYVGAFTSAIALALSSYYLVGFLWVQSAKKEYRKRKTTYDKGA